MHVFHNRNQLTPTPSPFSSCSLYGMKQPIARLPGLIQSSAKISVIPQDLVIGAKISLFYMFIFIDLIYDFLK